MQRLIVMKGMAVLTINILLAGLIRIKKFYYLKRLLFKTCINNTMLINMIILSKQRKSKY